MTARHLGEAVTGSIQMSRPGSLPVSAEAAWEGKRNESGARIKWMFTTKRARVKLARAYPRVVKESKPL